MRLQGGLMSKPVERGVADADRRLADRREVRTGPYAALREPLHLTPPDAGDEAQMIFRVPPLLAVVPVVADPAVRHRIRREIVSHAGVAPEATPDRAVVRDEVATPEPL